MREITFSDAKKTEQCYLFQLAHAPQNLGLFRHVLLVSSPQDKYVPHHSARVQLTGMTLKKVGDGVHSVVHSFGPVVHSVVHSFGPVVHSVHKLTNSFDPCGLKEVRFQIVKKEVN